MTQFVKASFLCFALLAGAQIIPEIQQPNVSGCTPGVFAVTASGGSICCMGGHPQSLTLSDCPGWPLCSGPATVTPTSKPLSCATVITYADDSEYSSEVSAASASMAKSGVHMWTTLGPSGSVGTGDASAAAPSSSSSSEGSGPSGSSNSAGRHMNVFSGDGTLLVQLGGFALAIFGCAVLL